MKNSNIHATLSDVHRLLSTHTTEDFARASEYHGLTPHLRAALRALSLEARGRPESEDSRESPTDKPSALARRAEPPEIPTPDFTEKSSLVSLLQQQPRFVSTQSILQFAKELGLNIEARAKEGRERLASRVVDAILKQSAERQSQMVAKLVAGADSQTQGWLNVIKGSRS